MALLQGNEMSVGWHFISGILGLCSCQATAKLLSPWPSGQHISFQPQRPYFEPQEGRAFTQNFFRYYGFVVNVQ